MELKTFFDPLSLVLIFESFMHEVRILDYLSNVCSDMIPVSKARMVPLHFLEIFHCLVSLGTEVVEKAKLDFFTVWPV